MTMAAAAAKRNHDAAARLHGARGPIVAVSLHCNGPGSVFLVHMWARAHASTHQGVAAI
jgi:hypothetical protein